MTMAIHLLGVNFWVYFKVVRIVEIPHRDKRSDALVRCSRKVSSTGTGSFKGDNKRCAREARYEVKGVRLYLCTQHAGEFALDYLMRTEGVK